MENQEVADFLLRITLGILAFVGMGFLVWAIYALANYWPRELAKKRENGVMSDEEFERSMRAHGEDELARDIVQIMRSQHPVNRKATKIMNIVAGILALAAIALTPFYWFDGYIFAAWLVAIPGCLLLRCGLIKWFERHET